MAERWTLLVEGRAAEVQASMSDGRLRLRPAALQAALGWEWQPQGFCKGTRCVPVTDAATLLTAEGVDLAGFAALLRQPLAVDGDARVACLGVSADDRAGQLASLQAPDFTLPDLSGTRHSLSDYRGRKVLLVAYASW
ncbi:MAG: redoxin domain-containing protein [Deltaproteobacteria bacterium]|nr:redoxin domain-containing protein [Deltaproteobacteria bacterium]